MKHEKMEDAEEWRELPSFPEYAVSSTGKIVRVKIDARGHRLTSQPLKPATSTAGYLSVTLCSAGKKRNARVNRIVCEAFYGPAPSDLHHAAHKDGVRSNNFASNLAWKLPVANEADKRLHGTAAIGERHWSKHQPEKRAKGEGHGLAKLTAPEVREIRADTRSQRDIAAAFGVSQRAIWNIKHRLGWRHVA